MWFPSLKSLLLSHQITIDHLTAEHSKQGSGKTCLLIDCWSLGLGLQLVRQPVGRPLYCFGTLVNNFTLEGEKLSAALVLSGVPQGSVLGPLLFLIYIDGINNLSLSTEACSVTFADDIYSTPTASDSCDFHDTKTCTVYLVRFAGPHICHVSVLVSGIFYGKIYEYFSACACMQWIPGPSPA